MRSVWLLSLVLCSGPVAGGSEPFAEGTAKKDLRWELRVNLPRCQHEGQARNAWCKKSDAMAATEKSGVEARLQEWILDAKSIQLAFFSFSDAQIAETLCEAASSGTRVTLFIDVGNIDGEEVVYLDSCPDHEGAADKTKIVAKGKRPLGSSGGHLQHVKILLASEDVHPVPLARLEDPDEAELASSTRTRFTTSSANLSSFGTSLHFENWLFFDAPTTDYLAQLNLCLFDALGATKRSARRKFASKYAACRDATPIPPRKDIEFFVTPHDGQHPRAYNALAEVIDDASSELFVAAHRLTTSLIYNPIGQKSLDGVDVSVILDDDTLRTGVENGGPTLPVSSYDVKAERALTDDGADVVYMETRATEHGFVHLHHNKFMVADNNRLFQGSGNFTAIAFNLYGLGHYEQFYLIRNKEIIQAYRKVWRKLYRRATAREDHPVGDHVDLPLCEIAPGGCD